MNIVTIIAIICITALLIVALANGFDGAMLAGGVAIIAGLGGWKAKQKLQKPPKE